MAEKRPRTIVRVLGNLSLSISCVLFLVFAADVLLGKASADWGWKISIRLTDVGEYLVLFSTAFFFTVATLLREYQSSDENTPSDPDRIVAYPSATTEENIQNDR